MSKVCSCRGEKGGICGERRSDQEDEDKPLLERELRDSNVKGQESDNNGQVTPSDSKDAKS